MSPRNRLATIAPNKVVKETDVWDGAAHLSHIVVDTNQLFDQLPALIAEAVQIRRSRLQNRSVKAVLAALRVRGFDLDLRAPDRNDMVGLIGEIVTGEYSEREGRKIIYAKWRAGGTSKSNGIDLIASSDAESEYDVLEAKHLHEELKGLTPSSSISHFRDRLLEGLDELRDEEVKEKVAAILIKVNNAIRFGQAVGFPQALTETRLIFEELLTRGNYSIGIVECSDSKYLDVSTTIDTSNALSGSQEVSERATRLVILECDDLETTTDRICDQHAR